MIQASLKDDGLFGYVRWPLLEFLATALGLALVSTAAQEPAPSASTAAPIWDHSLEVHVGLGYTDNVLLAAAARQSTPFTIAGLDAALFRAALDGPEVSLFISGEDRRFLGDVGVGKDETWIAFGRIQRHPRAGWGAGLSLQYLYQDQVFDVSATETNLLSVQLKGHGLKGTPSLTKDLWENYELRLEWPVARQFLAEPLDDYWENAPRLTFERTYGHRSTAALSYTFAQRLYDSRPQTDRAGAAILGTDLRLQRHEFELADRHYWDVARHWRSETKLGLELNSDNGSGYWDFLRYRVSHQLRYTGPQWNLQASARLNYYRYDVQPADPPSSDHREVVSISMTLRGEKDLTKSAKGFLEISDEQNNSNRTANEYRALTVSGGLNWEF